MRTRTRNGIGVLLAGLAAVVPLAGCSSGAAEPGPEPTSAGGKATPDYADGSYTADGGYQSPGGAESVTVTLTLADNTITELEVTGSGGSPNAKKFQGEFIENIDDIAVGRSIADLDVSKVAGSSLTSGGFNEALDKIRADAS